MRWAGAAIDAADPALPDGVQALGDHVKAPKQLARRLAQIGVIKREQAARLAPMLKPGQRLVSREGDLWRWDGFSVAADAPAGPPARARPRAGAARPRGEDRGGGRRAAGGERETKERGGPGGGAGAPSAAGAGAGARAGGRALQQGWRAARGRPAGAGRAGSR